MSHDTSSRIFDPQDRNAYLIPDEPERFGPADWERMLSWMVEANASDLRISGGRPAMFEVNGLLRPITRHALNRAEVIDLGSGMISVKNLEFAMNQGQSVDDAVTWRQRRGVSYRFRFNATSIQYDGQRSVALVLRAIASTPPSLAEMDLPPHLVPALFHKRGIGLVVGETGSGKSTLLSAMIRHIVEDPDANVAVLTFEAPIEFVYDQVVMPSAAVDQSQVPQDVPSFAEGLRGALRRHPGVILIGEARDRETISAMLTAAASGHMTYTTVHANGVVETVQRIVNEFAAEEQARVAVGLVSSLRFILCQTLVPAARAGDRRVPIREYLVMDDRVKRDLFGADGQVAGITQRARAVLAQHGHSFLQDARARHAEGRISMETLETFERIERAESGAQSAPTSSMPSFDDLLLPEVSHG